MLKVMHHIPGLCLPGWVNLPLYSHRLLLIKGTRSIQHSWRWKMPIKHHFASFRNFFPDCLLGWTSKLGLTFLFLYKRACSSPGLKSLPFYLESNKDITSTTPECPQARPQDIISTSSSNRHRPGWNYRHSVKSSITLPSLGDFKF